MKNILFCIPFNLGAWQHVTAQYWTNIYYMESVIDWSILPQNCFGKLYSELYDDSRYLPGNIPNEELHEVGIRLMYQQEPAKFMPIEGSEILIKKLKRWHLEESQWFRLPRVPGVSCIWIQGKTEEGGNCAVALVNLVIAEEI